MAVLIVLTCDMWRSRMENETRVTQAGLAAKQDHLVVVAKEPVSTNPWLNILRYSV